MNKLIINQLIKFMLSVVIQIMILNILSFIVVDLFDFW